MSALLRETIGQEVLVDTISSQTYFGVVLSIGSQWLYLNAASKKETNKRLIPLRNIRLIIPKGVMLVQSADGELEPSLIGQTVRVDSTLEYAHKDTGVLEAFDENWLRVKVKNEQRYFGVSGVREVTLL